MTRKDLELLEELAVTYGPDQLIRTLRNTKFRERVLPAHEFHRRFIDAIRQGRVTFTRMPAP